MFDKIIKTFDNENIVSERCDSQRGQNSGTRRSSQGNLCTFSHQKYLAILWIAASESCVSDVDNIYSITKQDYKNLAPPRYSAIYVHPTPVTYVEPPPYSPAIR